MMTKAEQEKLYKEYRGKVLGYIRSRVNDPHDAEDLCMDVFLKAYRASGDFDPDRASPGTWLFAISRNVVNDHFRRERPAEELPEDLADENLVESELIESDLLEKLAESLENLPPEMTDIIVLHYYDRLSLNEIAARLGMSYGAIKLRHQRALALLRTQLEAYA